MEEPVKRLKHLKEFQEILDTYHVSDTGKNILKKTNLVLLTGPTASGRNTIINELVETGNYYFIVSDTTRAPELRDGRMEQNGRQYFFRSEEEILEDLKQGLFLEAELIHNQQVSGMSMREIEKAASLEKIAITDIDILGVQNVVEAKPDTFCVLVLPPDFQEWQRRIIHRGFMKTEEVRRRLETAVRVFTIALERDYFKFILNDTVDNAAIYINLLAHFGQYDKEYQKKCRILAEKLLKETEDHLKTLS
jgi:guanylate kinase